MKHKPSKNNIQESFDTTLKGTNLQDIIIDMSDITIDTVLRDELLKEIPVVKTLVAFAKLGANIHDRLFLKKIISFMNELKDIPSTERSRMIGKIDASKKHRVKVGEKLLYIIDSCNDYENSELVARLFKAFIQEKISYDEFMRSSNAIERIAIYDLKWFLKNVRKYMGVEEVGSLISSGLFDLYYEKIDVTVEDQDDYESRDKYKTLVDGGEAGVTISRIGEIILEIIGKTEGC